MDSRIRKKKKRKSRKRKLLLSLIILIIAVIGYSAIQYYQGVNQTAESDRLKMDNVKFNGQKDQYGRTNVLLLGVDARGGQKASRTDSIMIAQYDPNKKTVKLVSVMRDIFADIPGYKPYKINTAYFLGGPELLRQTLKQNLGIDVQYYAIVDFNGFVKVIDTLAPDGIEVTVPHDMSKNIGVTLHKGTQKLHGKELLGFSRFRHDSQGDFGRVARQQEVLKAIKSQVLSISGIAKAPKLLGTIAPYVATNMNTSDRMGVLTDLLLHPGMKIKTMTIPVKGTYQNARSSYDGDVLEIDKEKNREALSAFLGEDLTTGQSADTTTDDTTSTFSQSGSSNQSDPSSQSNSTDNTGQ
ncbi:LCP family protein [Heyndrickxia acidicola]|uniref:Regulatory protein MsrR n=1 Tax=Heyndrickxia acidicola TaxID=209389 RepID=A0ABU6MJK0_9BACI|nr:LCP family protein [Heyndrickxia acidicola]MED1204639.1 LCP family protein [Heyndrickxia acidicola]